MKKKIALSLSVLTLAIAVAIGGTMAYLTATTGPVTNTFTFGKVAITLKETPLTENDSAYDNAYTVVPGGTYSKDPTVTVAGGSEACYLFIQVTEDNQEAVAEQDGISAINYFDYEITSDWTPLTPGSNIYWRTVPAVTADTPFGVLVNDQITVSDQVTSQMIQELGTNAPKLAFTAYAVQQSVADTALDAWNATFAA